MKPPVLAGRLLLGGWMLANGINHFLVPLWTQPTGTQPAAVQLMAALMHSGLFGVAMAIQLLAGALLLAGLFVPLALCVLLPVSTCALYWSLVLDRQPLGAVLAIAAFALNALLMLAYLPHYRGALQRHAPSLGETRGGIVYESVFADPKGRTARGPFVPALLVLLAAILFYALLVGGRTAQWCLLVLLYPAVVLHARRLHDMGHTAWLLLVPAVLLAATLAIRVQLFSLGAQMDAMLPPIAVAIAAAVALWGCLGRGQAAANRFGPASG